MKKFIIISILISLVSVSFTTNAISQGKKFNQKKATSFVKDLEKEKVIKTFSPSIETPILEEVMIERKKENISITVGGVIYSYSAKNLSLPISKYNTAVQGKDKKWYPAVLKIDDVHGYWFYNGDSAKTVFPYKIYNGYMMSCFISPKF